MASLKQLTKERNRLLKIREQELNRQAEIQKQRNLQREIFMLKHGKKVDALKKVGSSLAKGFGKAQQWAEKRQAATPKRKSSRRQNNDYGYGGSLF